MSSEVYEFSAPYRSRRSRSVIPRLENGDRLSEPEFMLRYEAMPDVKKAELIDGIVYIMSPVSADFHGGQHTTLTGLLWTYAMLSSKVACMDNTTVRISETTSIQPDTLLKKLPEGASKLETDDAGYLVGIPDLIAEVSGSSASIDLGRRRDICAAAGVSEYLVWVTYENSFHWWHLEGGAYQPLPENDGVFESRAFPGLVIDAKALLEERPQDALARLQQSLGNA